MKSEILYHSNHPDITISHNVDTGDIVFERSDKYMRNPNGTKPAFVPERIVLFTVKE